MRRAQGLSINTIILAALGIIVLAVLAFMVFDAVNSGQDSTKACSLQGGTCKGSCDPLTEDTVPNTFCAEDPQQGAGRNLQCCRKKIDFPGNDN